MYIFSSRKNRFRKITYKHGLRSLLYGNYVTHTHTILQVCAQKTYIFHIPTRRLDSKNLRVHADVQMAMETFQKMQTRRDTNATDRYNINSYLVFRQSFLSDCVFVVYVSPIWRKKEVEAQVYDSTSSNPYLDATFVKRV